MTDVHIRNCHLCEAGCGLRLTVEDERVRVAPNRDDVSSAGHICPKGALIGDIDADPDRIRTPMVRRDGELVPATWDEAFAVIEERLPQIVAEHGRDAVATFVGNPHSHNLAASMFVPHLLRMLKTKNRYSAGSVDAWPQQLAALLMSGHSGNLMLPDLDRTDMVVIFGANPAVSNGSLATAPGWGKRLLAIRERGGEVVVLDPRRTETAELATEHVFIRPGTDALVMLAIITTLFDEDLVDLGAADGFVRGLDDVRSFAARYTPESVSARTGVDSAWIRSIARRLAATERSTLYGRIGVSLQELGLVAAWGINCINVLIGSVDRPGGAMFCLPATGLAALKVPLGRPPALGRWRSRVSGHREVFGEFPAVGMLEEMTTPGEGQIRALITHSANPVLSVPGGDRLAEAIAGLDLVVCLDVFVNETTRLADVILPSPGGLERSFYPYYTQQFSTRSYARFSTPYRQPPAGQVGDDDIIMRIGATVAEPAGTPEQHKHRLMIKTISAYTADDSSPIHGRDAEELLTLLHGDSDPERLLDLYLRTGPFGDQFGERDGINLAVLAAAPNGMDFGPMLPLLPDIIRTADQKIDLLPEPISELAADIQRIHEDFDGRLQLIGRRQLRSNNSWMHNVPRLLGAGNTCCLLMHPSDAQTRGIKQDDEVAISTDVGRVVMAVELTNAIMPGVVCAPHGWGHQRARMSVAAGLEGSSINDIIPLHRVDVGSGNAAPNGVSVDVVPVL